MEKLSKLEDLVNENVKEYINFKDLVKNIDNLREKGYNFIDEQSYITEKAGHMSIVNNIDFMLAENLIPRRDFEYEVKNLYKINEIIPENSVKPVAFVYDDSIEKNYIRGYLTKSNSESIPLKEYIHKGLKGEICLSPDKIVYMEKQINDISLKLKQADTYNRIPPSVFAAENIQVDKNNNIILMNTNYMLVFSERKSKYIDNEIRKTIKYLDKAKKKL